ncbi:hypothetical protein B296_00006821 [Ensete ventricosum]|uniref:Uncharacterized protein n=1 Tax=Ensete ventricosum TaxID=4639 RepID=A0A426ZKM5_ENSVE|nr:hypothetical protein B296_00006821 [Ensete ventricosum]
MLKSVPRIVGHLSVEERAFERVREPPFPALRWGFYTYQSKGRPYPRPHLCHQAGHGGQVYVGSRCCRGLLTWPGSWTQVRQMENELLKLTRIMDALWIDLSKQAVEDYKKLLGFEIGLLQMGRVSLQYDYQLALARLRAWHPNLEIEEDPFNLLPEIQTCRWQTSSPLMIPNRRPRSSIVVVVFVFDVQGSL